MNDDRTLLEELPGRKTRSVEDILHFLTPQQMAEEIVRLDAASAALSAAPAQEPVAWQMRRDYAEPDDPGWGIWHECSEDDAKRLTGRTDVQVRTLYASPLPQEPQEGKELTDSDQMRAEFMAWAQDRGCDTDGAWSAWQACWNLRGAQEGKAGEWLPIESAPKNVEWSYGVHGYGKHILGWCPGYEPFRCRWWESKSGACNFIADGGMSCHPTHWQPLPPPPSSTLSASSKGEQR